MLLAEARIVLCSIACFAQRLARGVREKLRLALVWHGKVFLILVGVGILLRIELYSQLSSKGRSQRFINRIGNLTAECAN
jgi:hypothetical protein